MNSLKNILLFGGCCLLLSGCTGLGDVTRDLRAAMADLTGDQGTRETVYASGETNVSMTYPEMAREMSGGSVKVYGLDGPAAPMATAPSRSSMMAPVLRGVPASGDANVTVFPFDDESRPQYPETTSPYLAPPSEQYRPLQSPFGGPIQTPAEAGPYEPMTPFAPATSYPAQDETSRIYFGHGSSKVNSTGKQVVEHVSLTRPVAVVVDGHASARAEVSDPVQRDIVNLEMSMKRAVKVSSDLIRQGVPVERIETRAFGTARPAAPVHGINQEAANRRVEIHTEGGAVYEVPSYSMSGGAADLTESAPIPPLARY